MAQPRYDAQATLREARLEYFERNSLGDGAYDDRSVVFRVLGLTVRFPNTPERVRSVRLHDVHHVLTEYGTSWTGEAEIAAWELASGCANHPAAWILNSFAALIGIFIAPSRLRDAIRRGRASRNLYTGEWDDALLDRQVGELRVELNID